MDLFTRRGTSHRTWTVQPVSRIVVVNGLVPWIALDAQVAGDTVEVPVCAAEREFGRLGTLQVKM